MTISANKIYPGLKVCLILLAVFWVFQSAIHFQFLNLDDNIHTDRNPNLNPPSLEGLKTVWREPYRKLYIPLTYTVWAAVASWGGKPQTPLWQFDAGTFHCLNIILHALACGLLVLPLMELLLGENGAALMATLFFAIHPLQVEPVCWISGLKDILSGFFGLLALNCFAKLLLEKKPTSFWRGAALCALIAGLLSKPSVAALPLMALALGTIGLNFPGRKVAKELSIWLVVVLPFALITRSLQPAGELEFAIPNLAGRFLVALQAIWFYIRQILLPLSLSIDYSQTPERILQLPWAHWVLLLILTAGGVHGLIRLWPNQRLLVAAVTMAVAAVLPVLGFQPFVFQLMSTVADRYLYLSLFGAALFFGQLLLWVGLNRRVSFLGFGVLLALALIAKNQAGYWRDSESLFTHTLAVNPQSWLAHNNLGVVYEGRGDLARAIVEYGQSNNLRPNPTVLNNLGAVMMAQRQFFNAIHCFQQALELKPNDAMLFNNIGSAWLELGRRQKALENFLTALRYDPTLKEPRQNLAKLEN